MPVGYYTLRQSNKAVIVGRNNQRALRHQTNRKAKQPTVIKQNRNRKAQ